MKSQMIRTDGRRRSMYGGPGGGPESAGPRKLPTNTLTMRELDAKCKIIVSEIDRCEHFSDRYIESSVLHSVPQMFVPNELCAELELELDRLLTEQLCREEQQLLTPASAATISPLESHLCHLKPNQRDNANVEASITSDPDVSCCTWTPFCDANLLARRRKELYRELKSCEKQTGKTAQSVVARSALRGGETKFIRKELIKELADEIRQLGSKLKLIQIDYELHQAFTSRDKLVTIRSIHGYDMTVKRRDGILALEHEHDRHISQLVAVEIIDNILEWMLEGWYFGERDSKDKKSMVEAEGDIRGSLIDKAKSVQWSSNMNAMRDACANEANKEDLEGIETNIRMFCLTFMYFRALHVLRKEKSAWDGSNDLVSLCRGPPLGEERKRIMQEEKNADFRKNRIDCAMQKARAGEERKRERIEKERLEQAKLKQWYNKTKLAEQRLAITVQKVFRGYLGRKSTSIIQANQERTKSAEALMNNCATDIARVWRGYCGRIDAGYLRAEMAKFLFAIREEEARDEAEEYTNRLQRKLQLRKGRNSS